jgi:hypothetical protein
MGVVPEAPAIQGIVAAREERRQAAAAMLEDRLREDQVRDRLGSVLRHLPEGVDREAALTQLTPLIFAQVRNLARATALSDVSVAAQRYDEDEVPGATAGWSQERLDRVEVLHQLIREVLEPSAMGVVPDSDVLAGHSSSEAPAAAQPAASSAAASSAAQPAASSAASGAASGSGRKKKP